jgi:pimeloyl-ACP methyl ester carboxylesterase
VSNEHHDKIDGEPVFWRSAPGGDVLYVHGVPTNSDIWEPFLVRAGGIAVDLPGFGRTTKRGDLDFTIDGYGLWLDRFAEHVGLERFSLVVEDWGAVALPWAARRHEQIERLVIIDAVPLLPGYRWHWIARAWRTRGLGEFAMGLTIGPVTRRLVPREIADAAIPHFDQGTQRAILRLYRSADPAVLAAPRAQLEALDAPALIAWGERDPYIPSRFADGYAARLGGEAQLLKLPDAGHWPWLDRPDLVETVGAFLGNE